MRQSTIEFNAFPPKWNILLNTNHSQGQKKLLFHQYIPFIFCSELSNPAPTFWASAAEAKTPVISLSLLPPKNIITHPLLLPFPLYYIQGEPNELKIVQRTQKTSHKLFCFFKKNIFFVFLKNVLCWNQSLPFPNQTSPAGGTIINRSTMDHSSSWKNPTFTKLYGLGGDKFQRWFIFALCSFLAPPAPRPAAGCNQEALAVMIYFPLLLLLPTLVLLFLFSPCGKSTSEDEKNEISGRPLSRTKKK